MEFRWGWVTNTITEKNLYCGTLSSNTISSEMNDNLDGTYTFTTPSLSTLAYNQIYICNTYDSESDLICDIISQVEANGITILTVRPNYHITFLRLWCRKNLNSKEYHYCRVGDLNDEYKLIDDKELEDLTNSLRIKTNVAVSSSSVSTTNLYYVGENSNTSIVNSINTLPAIYALFVADNNGVVMIPIIDAKDRTHHWNYSSNNAAVIFTWPMNIKTIDKGDTISYTANTTIYNYSQLSNDYYTVGCLAGVLGDSVLGMFPIPNFWTMVNGNWTTWTQSARLYRVKKTEVSRAVDNFVLGFQIEKLSNITFQTYIENSLSYVAPYKNQTTLSVSASRYLKYKTNMIEYTPYKWWMIGRESLSAGRVQSWALVGMNLDWEGIKIWFRAVQGSVWPVKDRCIVSNVKLSFPSSKFAQWYAQNAANIENARNTAGVNMGIGVLGGVISTIMGVALGALTGGLGAPLGALVGMSATTATVGGIAKAGGSVAKGITELVAINKNIENNQRIMAGGANIYNSNYLTPYITASSSTPTSNYYEVPTLTTEQIKTLNNFLYYNGEVCDYYGTLGLRTRAIRMAQDSAIQFRNDIDDWLNGYVSSPVNAIIKGYNPTEIIDDICNSFLNGIFIVV